AHRLLGLGRGVERVGAGVDEHRVGDADLRGDVPGAGDAVGHDVDPRGRVDKAVVPERGAGGVGVKGVDAVVFRGDEHDVVQDAVDVDAGFDQRLAVDRPVHRVVEELAEGGGADGGRGQLGLVGVDPGVVAGNRATPVQHIDRGG